MATVKYGVLDFDGTVVRWVWVRPGPGYEYVEVKVKRQRKTPIDLSKYEAALF